MTALSPAAVQVLSLGGGRQALAVRVSHRAELPAALAALGLIAPRPVLVLVGGANGLNPGLGSTLLSVFRALSAALRAVGAVVLDGGTRAGVMALMGAVAAESGPPLLGVAAVGTVRLPWESADGPVASHDADRRADLDPGHGRFLLVPGLCWGDESPWLAAAASAVAGGLPSLTLVVGGGGVTARDLQEGLRMGRPALVLAGTGGTADAVAASLDAGRPPPIDLPARAPGQIQVLDLGRAHLELPPLLVRMLGP